jgi:peptidoglycan/xylan/chitin deacetylase (PgdA/CDA1 family)
MAANPLKVVIFTSVPPRQVARVMARIRRDAPQAQVVGVLYERRSPKTLQQRMRIWRKKMARLVYWRYLLHRILATVDRQLTSLLDAVIRFIHAAPKRPNGNPGYGLDDLHGTCKTNGAELFITRDIHCEQALDFVRRIDADLGLVFGTRILKPVLFEIPKQGSINIHKRKVPDYRGGGAVGLWELLDDQMILYHHLVSDRPHRFGVSTAYFLRQVNYLLRHYRVLSLSEAVELVRKGGVKVPTVAITFDDGYADNFVNLRAITEETGLPIGYFISTEHISSGREFAHDQLFNEHGFPPNTWEQVEFLQRCGYEIGSHTRNHADCGSTDEEFLRHEIVGSGEDLQQKLGPIAHFSFPFGLPQNISAPAAAIACASYRNVFSAYRGGNFHAEVRRILKRGNFPPTRWELELQLQSVLTGNAKEPPHLKVRIDEH